MTNGTPNVFMKGWNRVVSFTRHSVVSLALGGMFGFGTSYFFYDLEKSGAVETAREQGRLAGHAKGMSDAEKANEINKPKWIEDRYPQALQLAKESGRADGLERGRREGRTEGQRDGFAEGDRAGFSRGREAGHSEGYRAGHDEGRRQSTLQRHAEVNWQNYSIMVGEAAKRADSLESRPGDKDLERKLRDEARSLVKAAEDLRSAHAAQASAFNSIMDDLKAALEAQDLPAVRAHLKALQRNLKIKGDLFLQASQRIAAAFESLRVRN
jgi:flagellar biosynthesis/type III secretory pathway protein FliH